MGRYEIYEGNMERLEKKLAHIYNKCKAYGCDFHYEKVGETFRELTNDKGNKYVAKFIIVEADGTAVMNDWEFVAAVEHTEKGNIFSGVKGIEIPKQYYDTMPVCEHCGANRYRKYTYIVHNKKTDEFKQVGKNCLNDFTHGLSAEAITRYMSLFDELIHGDAPYKGVAIEKYISLKEYLLYVSETIRYFGYVKASDNAYTTALRASDYYYSANGHRERLITQQCQEEMAGVGFDIHSERAVTEVENALKWLSLQSEKTNYMHNLKTVCSLEYITVRNLGLVASLLSVYQKAQNENQKSDIESAHIGKVGDHISFDVASIRCSASWETDYGTKRLLRITDKSGNIYIWKTGVDPNSWNQYEKLLSEGQRVQAVCTVKEHSEFRGEKQTIVMRCTFSVK